MHFLEHYYQNTIKYDLINKFKYNNLNSLPKLKKIVLNFNCKNSDLKQLAASFLALELITSQTSILTTVNKPNILLKIRKGQPTGCKIILQNKVMYKFIERFIGEILLKSKDLKNFCFKNQQKSNSEKNSFSYKLKNNLIFSELEKNYYLFNKLVHLNITFITNNISYNEFIFLIRCFKIPII